MLYANFLVTASFEVVLHLDVNPDWITERKHSRDFWSWTECLSRWTTFLLWLDQSLSLMSHDAVVLNSTWIKNYLEEVSLSMACWQADLSSATLGKKIGFIVFHSETNLVLMVLLCTGHCLDILSRATGELIPLGEWTFPAHTDERSISIVSSQYEVLMNT